MVGLMGSDDNTAFNDFAAERDVTSKDILQMSAEELEQFITEFRNRNNSDPDLGRD